MATDYMTFSNSTSPAIHASPDQVYDAFLNELPCDLHEYIVDGPLGCDSFDHPFMFLPSFKSFICANFTTPGKLADDLAAMRSQYDALCLEGEFVAALDLVEKRYRRNYFADLINENGVEPLLPAIRSVWVSVDLISADYWLWDFVWSQVGAIENSQRHIIRPDDLDAFDALPGTLTVYRGFRDCVEPHCSNPNCLNHEMEYGWSWTLNREQAEWFARRWSSGLPRLATAKISKKKVLAYFNDRNEQEIVLHPDYLSCEIDFTIEALSEHEEAA